MKKENLEFCFKGTRTYVQSPDIFDAVVKKLKKHYDMNEITDIKYSAYEMLYSNADMIVTTNFNKDDYQKINSIITFKIEDKKYYIIVVENENKIDCSQEYSEELVREKSIINGSKIEFINLGDDSITEIAVSMDKYYFQETITNDGKWIVTKFEYKNLKDLFDIKGKRLGLELKNNFNNKLTKSIITIDDKAVGYLYFSLI